MTIVVVLALAGCGGEETITRSEFCEIAQYESCVHQALTCPLQADPVLCRDRDYTGMGWSYGACCSHRDCAELASVELPRSELDACLASIEERTCEELQVRSRPPGCEAPTP
jgi:hypothetical protein